MDYYLQVLHNYQYREANIENLIYLLNIFQRFYIIRIFLFTNTSIFLFKYPIFGNKHLNIRIYSNIRPTLSCMPKMSYIPETGITICDQLFPNLWASLLRYLAQSCLFCFYISTEDWELTLKCIYILKTILRILFFTFYYCDMALVIWYL